MMIMQKLICHHICLLKGIYSRGKSHVLHLSVPIQLLLAEFEAIEEVSLIKWCGTVIFIPWGQC